MQCGWDGGDCDEQNTLNRSLSNSKENLLEGELSLILLGNSEELLQKLPEILIKLSHYLQVSVRIIIDLDGYPLIHKWQKNSGIGELIKNIPFGNNSNLLYKHEDKDFIVKRSLIGR